VKNLVVAVLMTECLRGNKHKAATQPKACVYDQIADRPSFVIKEKILHVADIPISCSESIAIEFFDIK
jgi:hypothetical protein